jgi:hypothetical protein
MGKTQAEYLGRSGSYAGEKSSLDITLLWPGLTNPKSKKTRQSLSR